MHMFNKNFGHQEALTAGLSKAKSDLIAVLDGDLQDLQSWQMNLLNQLKRL